MIVRACLTGDAYFLFLLPVNILSYLLLSLTVTLKIFRSCRDFASVFFFFFFFFFGGGGGVGVVGGGGGGEGEDFCLI